MTYKYGNELYYMQWWWFQIAETTANFHDPTIFFPSQDKTFGLKNKKGGKAQKFVEQVSKQVKTGGGKSAKELLKQEEEKAKKKEQARMYETKLYSIFSF